MADRTQEDGAAFAASFEAAFNGPQSQDGAVAFGVCEFGLLLAGIDGPTSPTYVRSGLGDAIPAEHLFELGMSALSARGFIEERTPDHIGDEGDEPGLVGAAFFLAGAAQYASGHIRFAVILPDQPFAEAFIIVSGDVAMLCLAGPFQEREVRPLAAGDDLAHSIWTLATGVLGAAPAGAALYLEWNSAANVENPRACFIRPSGERLQIAEGDVRDGTPAVSPDLLDEAGVLRRLEGICAEVGSAPDAPSAG